MRIPKSRHSGSVMMIVVFTLLVMLPVMMVFSRWIIVHRKGTTQGRVHIKEYFASNTAVDVGRVTFTAGTFTWNSTATPVTFTVQVDSGTVVTTEIRHVGSP